MTELQPTQKPATIQQLLKTDMIAKSAERTLGARGQQFLTSVLTLANSNSLVGACEPYSLYNACLTAATLDLPINQNLGFAYIVPYKNNKTRVTEAQFQMGYKGFIQLAIRSGKFISIGVNPVHEGQISGFDNFTGEPIFDFNAKQSETVLGYMAYFELTNGFRKVDFMSVEELEKHGKKYSQSYKKGFGVWKDNFDAMAKKTVIKLLLSKFAPLNTQMEQAIIDDQKIVDAYADNTITFEVENAAIEGETIDVQTTEDDYLDEPVEADVYVDPRPYPESDPTVAEAFEASQRKVTQPQMKKAFAIFNGLPEDVQETAEKGRKTLFGDKSRRDYTLDEANKWITYLLSLEEVKDNG